MAIHCKRGHDQALHGYARKGGGRFCSACCQERRKEKRRANSREQWRYLPWPDRLWARVDTSPGHGPSGECWPWMGYRDPNGYGQIQGPDGVLIGTHRAVLEMSEGSLPPEIFACHGCDWPPCCNPNHLFPGTAQDNADDMVAKGRSADMVAVSKWRRNPVGERNGMARLTWENVRNIRHDYKIGRGSMTHLASIYGITDGAICNIVNGKSWKESDENTPVIPES